MNIFKIYDEYTLYICIFKNFVNKTRMGRLFEKEDLLGRAKNRSRINLSNQGNLPARFSDKDMSQKRTRKKELPRKISMRKLLPPH